MRKPDCGRAPDEVPETWVKNYEGLARHGFAGTGALGGRVGVGERTAGAREGGRRGATRPGSNAGGVEGGQRDDAGRVARAWV